jgi:hypothetical protein
MPRDAPWRKFQSPARAGQTSALTDPKVALGSPPEVAISSARVTSASRLGSSWEGSIVFFPVEWCQLAPAHVSGRFPFGRKTSNERVDRLFGFGE